MRKNKRWTPAEDKMLSDMKEKDMSDRDMGIALGRTPAAVANRCLVLGLKRNRRPFEAAIKRMWRIGRTLREIAEELGVHPTTVIFHRKRLGLPGRRPSTSPREWTPAEDDQLRRLRARGLMGVEIEEIMGRNPSVQSLRAKKIGAPIGSRT